MSLQVATHDVLPDLPNWEDDPHIGVWQLDNQPNTTHLRAECLHLPSRNDNLQTLPPTSHQQQQVPINTLIRTLCRSCLNSLTHHLTNHADLPNTAARTIQRVAHTHNGLTQLLTNPPQDTTSGLHLYGNPQLTHLTDVAAHLTSASHWSAAIGQPEHTYDRQAAQWLRQLPGHLTNWFDTSRRHMLNNDPTLNERITWHTLICQQLPAYEGTTHHNRRIRQQTLRECRHVNPLVHTNSRTLVADLRIMFARQAATHGLDSPPHTTSHNTNRGTWKTTTRLAACILQTHHNHQTGSSQTPHIDLHTHQCAHTHHQPRLTAAAQRLADMWADHLQPATDDDTQLHIVSHYNASHYTNPHPHQLLHNTLPVAAHHQTLQLLPAATVDSMVTPEDDNTPEITDLGPTTNYIQHLDGITTNDLAHMLNDISRNLDHTTRYDVGALQRQIAAHINAATHT